MLVILLIWNPDFDWPQRELSTSQDVSLMFRSGTTGGSHHATSVGYREQLPEELTQHYVLTGCHC